MHAVISALGTAYEKCVDLRSSRVCEEDIFSVSQVLERRLLPLLLDVFLRPAVLVDQLRQFGSLAPVQSDVEPGHTDAADHVDPREDGDCRLA